jgi:thiamine-phosphate pyrophosphorylase
MLSRRSWQTWGVMSESAHSDRRARLRDARLYLVCDRVERDLLDAALHGGVDLVQLRMKTASDDEILATAGMFAALCTRHGALLILNDRPDLAVRAGADGVHVGQDDVPVAAARATVGADRLVGRSTHTPAQIDEAGALDLDYIGVGPVHATPTKPGRAPVGFELVGYAAAHASLPFFAIGGIDPTNVGAVVAAGASRVAVVRALTHAADPERVARALRAALEREREREPA